MGQAGRIACIFTPMALTIASFVCIILIELAGWSSGLATLNGLYFLKADFTSLTVAGAGTAFNTTDLTASLEYAQQHSMLADVYEVHLWNYCSASTTASGIDYCSGRRSGFVFDPVAVWGLNSDNVSSTATLGAANPLTSGLSTLQTNSEALENSLLGSGTADALRAYRRVVAWMFAAYTVAFWSTLATILFGILAIFSRWGSMLTWLASIVSTLFTFAASLTSTLLFLALTGALRAALAPYQIHTTLGTAAQVVTWLGALCSAAATLFWLASVCCCSSARSNGSNKGGLWAAGEPEAQRYGGSSSRGRGLRVEKTGGYHRLGSPYVGAGAEQQQRDSVLLAPYPARQSAPTAAFEPFRHA